WAALNNPDVLRAAMPGCESLEMEGENLFAAKITAKVGPVKAKFNFKVELCELDPPSSYTIKGEGQGGAAGFAKGSARVSLQEHESGTLLNYSVKASVGGKLAQLGGRLIDGTARKLADEFFAAFTAIVTDSPETAGADEPVNIAPVAKSKWAAWVWPLAAIAVLGLLLLFL
ncbi:MAG: SRPBCC domain-containing protein, partial [Gammaproteobacteria bacterium]